MEQTPRLRAQAANGDQPARLWRLHCRRCRSLSNLLQFLSLLSLPSRALAEQRAGGLSSTCLCNPLALCAPPRRAAASARSSRLAAATAPAAPSLPSLSLSRSPPTTSIRRARSSHRPQIARPAASVRGRGRAAALLRRRDTASLVLVSPARRAAPRSRRSRRVKRIDRRGRSRQVGADGRLAAWRARWTAPSSPSRCRRSCRAFRARAGRSCASSWARQARDKRGKPAMVGIIDERRSCDP